MNDIYIWLILLGIIYIVPEVFRQDKKRKGRGKYKYPQFPQFPPEKSPQTAPQPQKPAEDYPSGFGYEYYQPPTKTIHQEVFHFASPNAAPAAATLPSPVNIPPVTSSVSPWQGVLSPQVLANAVVFSEIFLPPRAHRPFGRSTGKNKK